MANSPSWNEVSRSRASDQVFAQLKAGILDGTLPTESLLPTEIELATAFGTSRTAVREAVRQLEILGLAESRQGSRRAVCSADRLRTFAVLGDVLMPGGELSLTALAAFMEFRCDAMTTMFRRAVEMATPDDWHDLRQLARLQGEETDLETMLERDWEFLARLADATHNPIYQMMAGSFIAVAKPLTPLMAKQSPHKSVAPNPFLERLVAHAERRELDAVDTIISQEIPGLDRLTLEALRIGGLPER